MKELELITKSSTKMDNGIEVKPYLTYSEIQAIVNQVIKFDSWSEREQSIDIMLIHFVTNISDESSRKIGHDLFVTSGVMEQIRNNVRNFEKIYEAIDYTESVPRAMAQISKQLPDMLEPIKKAVERGNKSSNK